MKSAPRPFPLSIRITACTLLSLVIVWLVAFAAIDRDYSDSIRSTEQRVLNKSQIFSEYTISTIKRVDQIARESALAWTNDQSHFGSFISRQVTLVQDIAFQISVIDKNGILLMTNRDPTVVRTDLSDREHFRVHQESQGADRLFISRPVVGRASRKWSIQFTRPILKDNHFDGVLVVSVDPGQFGAFGENLDLGKDGAASVIRDTGERMARFPINEQQYGQRLPDSRPFLVLGAPGSGTFTVHGAADGVERIYGFTRLTAYGVTTLVGESRAYALAPHVSFKRLVLGIGLLSTIFVMVIMYLLSRWTDEKSRREKAWSEANIDALTQLANRRAFLETLTHEIKRSERTGVPVVLLYLDIDHFKKINDIYGHACGDALLIAVASRLRKVLRQVDTIARMGGDEFTIILSELYQRNDIEAICQKILSKVSTPVATTNQTFSVTASIGIAIYPDDCAGADALINSADRAMYVSKQLGSNRYTFFSSAMQEETAKRTQLANDLPLPLTKDQPPNA